MFLVTNKRMENFKTQHNNGDGINEYIHPELLAFYAAKSNSLQKKLNTLMNGNAPGKLYVLLLRKKIAKLFAKNDAKRSE